MKQTILTSTVLASIWAMTATTASAQAGNNFRYPDGWEEMEIEAKWETSRSNIERMISDMADDSMLFGYQMKVRWGGIPRKFVDYYYDTPSGTLLGASHALRHRTRSTDDSESTTRNFSALLNTPWASDWEKIQYKSSPIRLGAVWFRREVDGGCNVWDDKNKAKSRCQGFSSMPPQASMAAVIADHERNSHDAIQFMLSDHPDVNPGDLVPVLAVTDLRYRVEFLSPVDGQAVLELSLDEHVSEDLRTVGGDIDVEYEAELELIDGNPSEDDLAELFRVAKLLELEYQLTPSGTSKGGNFVPETVQSNLNSLRSNTNSLRGASTPP